MIRLYLQTCVFRFKRLAHRIAYKSWAIFFGPQILVVTFYKYERYKLVLLKKVHPLHTYKQYSYYLTGLLFCVVFGAFSTQNALASGAPPQAPMGELAALPHAPSLGGRGAPLTHPPRGGASNCAPPFPNSWIRPCRCHYSTLQIKVICVNSTSPHSMHQMIHSACLNACRVLHKQLQCMCPPKLFLLLFLLKPTPSPPTRIPPLIPTYNFYFTNSEQLTLDCYIVAILFILTFICG